MFFLIKHAISYGAVITLHSHGENLDLNHKDTLLKN